MVKKFRVVKEVEANSITDALKKESGCEASEVYEIDSGEDGPPIIGFKSE